MDFSAFICGGYFLVKRIDRPSDLNTLVPETILTLSACFTDIAPDQWADNGYNYGDEERAAEALKFGIPTTVVPTLVNLFTSAVGTGHITNSFPNLAVGREFYRSCSDKTDIVLLGIGLERSLLSSLRSQLPDEVNRGYGLTERVSEDRSLESGGESLGFEPLGYDGTKFHSWLCHNAPLEAHQRFGIQTNRSGFIESFDDAVRVTRHLKATGAEPGIWEPWLVVQYASV